jgi:hypothetical protein
MEKKTTIDRVVEVKGNKVEIVATKVTKTVLTKAEIRRQMKIIKETLERCDGQIENINGEKEQLLKFQAEYEEALKKL